MSNSKIHAIDTGLLRSARNDRFGVIARPHSGHGNPVSSFTRSISLFHLGPLQDATQAILRTLEENDASST